MNRRTFLSFGVVVSACLTGCGAGVSQGIFTPAMGSIAPLFPGEPDLPDLTAPGQQPPTEIPNPQRFFATPDPVFAGPPRPRAGLDTFDHVVVVMFENRAFDYMLGYLYPEGRSSTGQPFNGVVGKNLFNPIPPYALEASRGSVPVSKAVDLNSPVTDPGEEYGTINVALYNMFNPPSNQFAAAEANYQAPYNLPNGGAFFPPTMDGWVKSFIWALQAAGFPNPTYAQYSSIMQCFPPNLVPVISQVAQAFGVCDNYFCGVPSQTITNRSFFHAAQSSGLVVNAPLSQWTGTPPNNPGNTAPTIFESLTAAGRSWTIYFHQQDVISLTRLLHYPVLSKFPFAPPYFKTMTDYYNDVESGNLPDYSFIEPRLLFDDNSYHPLDGPTATKRGELLLNDLYQALRNSNSPTGSNFQNTLLMVTFDEGGTCYDHVPPPPATPPFPNKPGDFGFLFDRLGQRIPTIFVSAYIDGGTVHSTQYDSTSMLATLEKKFSLKPLTGRDSAARDFSDIFNRTTPRPRDQWPRLRVRTLSPAEQQTNADQPLNDLQAALTSMVYHINTGNQGLPPGVSTVGQAMNYITNNPPK